ncbi:MAG: type I-C CRISPR-associated protein Cas8c/Csd1, partial [Fimbriimonadales bacterium]
SLMLETPVKWVLELDAQGKPQGMVMLSGGGNPKKDRGLPMQVPSLGGLRTSGIMPYLLADKADYVLGDIHHSNSRAQECNQAFVDLVKRCADATQLPEVQAVYQFYQHHRNQLQIPPDLKEEDYIVLSVDGVRLVERPEVKDFWQRYAPAEHELIDPQIQMQCLVCGEQKPPLRRHFIKLKGVPGGQTGGVSLTSANAKAFYSYELEEGFVSPICLECSEFANKALNYLLRQERHRMVIGDLAYVFWTREESEFDPFTLLSKPEPETVQKLLATPFTGRQVTLDHNDFYAVALSASGGRAVVRNFIETTLPQVQQNLQRWFHLQELVDWKTGAIGAPSGIYALAASLYRDANKEMRPEVPKALIECALTGSRLPDWILYQAVQRNRAEQSLTYPRAVLLKMALNTHNQEVKPMLDQNNHDPAYRCGRVLAILEAIQRSAVDPKATLVDRYYGSASTTPASIFGTLLRLAQSHLSKLRKEREGAYIYLSRELESALPDHFPAVLTLHQQAWFALGYYHQRAEMRRRATERSQQSQNTQEVIEDED